MVFPIQRVRLGVRVRTDLEKKMNLTLVLEFEKSVFCRGFVLEFCKIILGKYELVLEKYKSESKKNVPSLFFLFPLRSFLKNYNFSLVLNKIGKKLNS